MTSLYHLTENAQALYDLALLADEADNHDAAQAINEAFELLHGELAEKLESCAVILNRWANDVAAHKAEEKRLAERRKGIEKSIADLKARMLNAMNAADMTKSKGALHTVSLRKTPAKLIVDDAEAIPDEYMVPQPAKPDNAAIKKALLDGEVLSYAHLETGQSLGVK